MVYLDKQKETFTSTLERVEAFSSDRSSVFNYAHIPNLQLNAK